jgi:Terminase small subunit
MNIRQKRFAERVASGVPAMRAYGEAGYSNKGRNAQSNASALMENHGVQELIAELQSENRKLTKKDKEQKLARLEEIAWAVNAKPSDVIAAIRIHNEMTGDNAPQKHVINDGSDHLKSARERALSIASPLNLLAKNGRENVIQSGGN